jgi:hypothetical protein
MKARVYFMRITKGSPRVGARDLHPPAEICNGSPAIPHYHRACTTRRPPMTLRDTLRLLAACCILLANACGSDGPVDKEETTEPVCQRGTSYSCVGQGSCSGLRLCLADGSGFTECMCDSAGGQAGTQATTPDGGQAGTGATGDGGTAGTGATDQDSSVTDGSTSRGEICGNGVDDDDDGKVDCADSACDSLKCVAEPPAGFEGPVVVYVGNGAPPECAGAFSAVAFDAGASPSGSAATCSTCECTREGDGCPAFLDFGTGAASGCGGTTCTTSVSASCTVIEPPCLDGLTTAYLKPKNAGSAATCEPSEQDATKSKAKFGKQVRACALANAESAGCSGDELCLPVAGAPAGFANTLCVWKAGDVDCPAQGYSDKGVFYQDLDDTRTCTACSCDGPDCTQSWHVFASSDTMCDEPIITLTGENQCVQVNPSNNQLRVGVTIEGTGECTPSGGEPQGSVKGTDPITVCCMP